MHSYHHRSRERSGIKRRRNDDSGSETEGNTVADASPLDTGVCTLGALADAGNECLETTEDADFQAAIATDPTGSEDEDDAELAASAHEGLTGADGGESEEDWRHMLENDESLAGAVSPARPLRLWATLARLQSISVCTLLTLHIT